MKIVDCRTNHLENPIGYQMEKPVFSWKVEEAKGKKQTAARIQVSDEESMGKLLLDTGWSEELDSLAWQAEVVLAPYTRYFWTVQVRSDAGEETCSGIHYFETGKQGDCWNGKWIGCDNGEPRHPIFYKEVELAKEVASARLYICGLGLYEAYWNGKKIGEELLTPYCNNYNAWLQYQSYDVTAALQEGNQGFGQLEVMLGNGWYKGRFGFNDQTGKGYYGDSWLLIAELHVTYTDGCRIVIGTDDSWKVKRSHITFSNIYDGEWVDDTLTGLEEEAAVLVEAPKAPLQERLSTPVTVREKLPAVELIMTPAGENVLDLGQNITGTFSFRVQEPEGTKIHLQFGEILQQGNFYRENLRTAKAEYYYVSDGKEHLLTPHFTFYGYRYVKIEGVSNLKKEDFTGLALYSWLPRTGWLTTGHELVNRLIANTEWGQKDNFLDVPTDCPQRDERMGWTGDAEVFIPTACFQRESVAFYRKYLYDMSTEQEALGGMVPEVVPSFGHQNTSCAWGDAGCIIPWKLYEFYGDKEVLEKQFDSMKAWVDYITREDGDDNSWRRRFHYGDWLALDGPDGTDGFKGGTDDGLVASTYYRYSAQLVAKAARVLGKLEEAAKYEKLAEEILDKIRLEYYSPLGRCCIDTQTAYLLTLHHGMGVNPSRIAEALEWKLKANHGMLQTGFVGTPLLCEELSKAGRTEQAFALLLNEECPGWLYEVKLGATTIWERWNSVLADGSISSTGMNSLNHYSYGAIVEWIYSYVAGIHRDEEVAGFRKVTIAPLVNWQLQWVDAKYQSASGTWRSAWKIVDEHHLEIQITVPFGCAAELKLPFATEKCYEQPGNPDITRSQDGKYLLESGIYEFCYETTQSLKKRYHTGMPLEELMGNAEVWQLLLNELPAIRQIPPAMYGMSMRQITSMFGGGANMELLDELDRKLSEVDIQIRQSSL